MTLLRRHRYILLSLGIYWPALFVLTHIQVPQIAAQSGMSDKTMHGLAYLVLTFFVWLAVSPYQKIQWTQKKVWLVIAAIACYGAADEWLQSRLGRQMEFLDWIGNIKGMLLALGILTFLNFWPALLAVSTIFIFCISNLSCLLMLYPQFYLNTAFHLTAYTSLALLWMQHLDRYKPRSRTNPLWPIWAVSLPLLLLAAVKIAGQYWDKPFWWVDAATAVFGICAAVLVSWLVFRFHKKAPPAQYVNKSRSV